MAQITSEFIIKNELRPCIVNGQKALFHKWAETENVILKFDGLADADEIRRIRKEYHRAGCLPPHFLTEKIKAVIALVEYEDGQMDEVRPCAVRFIDNAHSEYDYTDRAQKLKKDRNNEKAEFACRVCFEKLKKDNPQAIDCAWRGLDNEYCPELKKILEREDDNK